MLYNNYFEDAKYYSLLLLSDPLSGIEPVAIDIA